MRKKIKRLACLCLTAVFGASLAASNLIAFADDGADPRPLHT